MDFSNRSILPYKGHQERARYFFETGLYEHYFRPPQKTFGNPFSGPSPLESQVAEPPLFAEPKGPQTVEQIIQNGYFAVPKGEPTTAILSDRKNTSWLALDDLTGQIRKRYDICYRNLYEIELSKCAAMNALFEFEATRGIPGDRQLYSKNKVLGQLYEQQREERVSLWQDVSRLRQSLPEAAQNYLGAYRKISILKAPPGDKP